MSERLEFPDDDFACLMQIRNILSEILERMPVIREAKSKAREFYLYQVNNGSWRVSEVDETISGLLKYEGTTPPLQWVKVREVLNDIT